MARDESPPFERGASYFGPGATITADDVTATAHIEGMEWVFEDIDLTAGPGAKMKRTGRRVKCRAVRNVGAAALLPKRLVTFQASGVHFGKRVDGYADTTAEACYPLDEWLPAAGLAVNDIGWIVVEGPAMVLTNLANAEGNDISIGEKLVALTAVTSGATTAGRAAGQAILGAATSGVTDLTDVFAAAQNFIGWALSARTTNNTNSDVLVQVGRL